MEWNCWCEDYRTKAELARDVIEAGNVFEAIRRFRSKYTAAQRNGVAVYIVKRGILDRLCSRFRKERVFHVEQNDKTITSSAT